MKYGAILADPPWAFKVRSDKGKGRSPDGPLGHYNTMTLDQIKALPVADLAAKDCCLFLWATSPMLPQAFETMAAWGFTFKTIGFLWAKLVPAAAEKPILPRMDRIAGEFGRHCWHTGLGYWSRANVELVLLGTRGRPKRLSASVRQLVVESVGNHSVKPLAVNLRIQELVAGPYLELFARRRCPGWSAWGDEVMPVGSDEFAVHQVLKGDAE